MPFVARAAVETAFKTNNTSLEEWHTIKISFTEECKWRIKDSMCEIVAGLFEEQYDALEAAKSMYAGILYLLLAYQVQVKSDTCSFYKTDLSPDVSLIKDSRIDVEDACFLWSEVDRYGGPGPSVYEVDSDLSEYEKCVSTLKGDLYFLDDADRLKVDRIEQYIFPYCEKNQQLLRLLVTAEELVYSGMEMVIYTSILESIVESESKSQKIIDAKNKLIAKVKEMDLSLDESSQLVNYLEGFAIEGSRGKCRRVAKQYAKESYDEYPTKTIIKQAYDVRSCFSHGGTTDYEKYPAALYIKYVVLDVIKNYSKEVLSN